MRAARAEGRSEDAAAVVVQVLGAEVFGFLRATMKDDDDAGDVFGMFSEDLLRGLPSYRGDASLRTWCYVLARHAAARFRRDPLRKRAVHDSAAWQRLAVQARDPTSVWRRTEVKDRARRLRSHLELEEQELLILRVDRALEWDDIASVLLDDDCPSRDQSWARKNVDVDDVDDDDDDDDDDDGAARRSTRWDVGMPRSSRSSTSVRPSRMACTASFRPSGDHTGSRSSWMPGGFGSARSSLPSGRTVHTAHVPPLFE